jgi:hypothetical protein
MNRKCYTCGHIKTCLFRLCIQLMGYEGSLKQNKFNIVHFSCNYLIILYSQRIDTNLCGNTVFRQFCVTITINSNVYEHLLARLSAKVGRLKCEVTDPDGLVYRNITVHSEAQKSLFHDYNLLQCRKIYIRMPMIKLALNGNVSVVYYKIDISLLTRFQYGFTLLGTTYERIWEPVLTAHHHHHHWLHSPWWALVFLRSSGSPVSVEGDFSHCS